MDVVKVEADGTEQVLASGLTPGEVGEVLEWWRYTKPFGPSTSIVVREQALTAFRMSTKGTTLGIGRPHPRFEQERSETFFG